MSVGTNTKSSVCILYAFSLSFYFPSHLFLLCFIKVFQNALEIFKIWFSAVVREGGQFCLHLLLHFNIPNL